MVWLFAVAFDCAVRQHKRPPLTREHLRLNVPEKEFGGLLLVSKLAYSVQVIPGDLKRLFYKNWSGSVMNQKHGPTLIVPFSAP